MRIARVRQVIWGENATRALRRRRDGGGAATFTHVEAPLNYAQVESEKARRAV